MVYRTANTGITSYLYDVECFNDNCIAVGPSGTIIKSSDGGINWSSKTSGVTLAIEAITYSSGRFIAVAYGSSGVDPAFLISDDDGDNWTSNTVAFENMYAIGPALGKLFAVGNSVKIYSSTDNGDNWVESHDAGAMVFRDVGGDANIAIVTGQSGEIYTSTDGSN